MSVIRLLLLVSW